MGKIDLTGQRFGRLVVLEEGKGHRQKSGKNVRQWICRCDCGNIKIVRQNNLMRDSYQTLSCGCLAREVRRNNAKKLFTTHGHRKERLYAIWCSMRSRCNKPRAKEYNAYGGRGIRVCQEWNDYETFRTWAYANGYDPNAKRGVCTIDRIDNDGGYCPENCRFADMKTQANNTQHNRKYVWMGRERTLLQIIEESGTKLSRNCLYKRLKKGMSVDAALLTPLMSDQYG